jgi:hypothetical protein
MIPALTRLPNHFQELFSLMESTVASLSSAVLHPFALSSQTTEFLQHNLLNNPLLSLGLIHNLLSPCIPHLADNDAALTALCVTALNTVIACLEQSCDTDKKGSNFQCKVNILHTLGTSLIYYLVGLL